MWQWWWVRVPFVLSLFAFLWCHHHKRRSSRSASVVLATHTFGSGSLANLIATNPNFENTFTTTSNVQSIAMNAFRAARFALRAKPTTFLGRRTYAEAAGPADKIRLSLSLPHQVGGPSSVHTGLSGLSADRCDSNCSRPFSRVTMCTPPKSRSRGWSSWRGADRSGADAASRSTSPPRAETWVFSRTTFLPSSSCGLVSLRSLRMPVPPSSTSVCERDWKCRIGRGKRGT
jgi:hypothetical protein